MDGRTQIGAQPSPRTKGQTMKPITVKAVGSFVDAGYLRIVETYGAHGASFTKGAAEHFVRERMTPEETLVDCLITITPKGKRK